MGSLSQLSFPSKCTRISVPASAAAGKVVAALDTGSSYPTLPAAAIAAIYGSVPGAVYDDTSDLWLLPCESSPNVTFVFG